MFLLTFQPTALSADLSPWRLNKHQSWRAGAITSRS